MHPDPSQILGFVRQSGSSSPVPERVLLGEGVAWQYSRSDRSGRSPVHDSPFPGQPEKRDSTVSGQILLVEDEPVIRSALRRRLERRGHRVVETGSVEETLEHHPPHTFDVVVTDLRLPGRPGTDLIEAAGDTPVLVITAHASVDGAVAAMRMGAADYLAKPFDPEQLILAVERLLERRRELLRGRAMETDLSRFYPCDGLVGDSPGMRMVKLSLHQAAPTDSTVLILGESGTGKELVARALHTMSPRSKGPFVPVNCAAVPESLLEAELFGYVKGAFTGANAARPGLVEAAHGGTLFLDEIGDQPLSAQAHLLRVLQERKVRRIGDTHERPVDIRLVAATNQDLRAKVERGEFRKDLYYRLAVVEIHLPPLRERGKDIPALAEHLLEKARKKLNRPPLRFTSEALERIKAHTWPGNVRELENVIERAVILSRGPEIHAESLRLDPVTPPGAAPSAPDPQDSAKNVPDWSLEEYFRRFVLAHQHELSESELAARLGISRKALWERRKRLGIPRPER